MLGLAHAPNDGGWPVFGHHFCSHENARFRHTAGFFNLVGCPLGHDVFFDFLHTVNAVVDVLGVFPAVFEDVIQHAENERNVGTRTQTDEFVSSCSGAGKARVHHNHLAAGFFGVQHVQQADRVRFSSVRADVQRALAVLHVVVRIGHCTIAPGVGNASNSGGVANTRLVVAVVAAPEADPLAQQISLLVVVLG